MKLTPVLKVEPNKPSEKKGVLGGFMLSWKWEDATAWISSKLNRIFARKGK
jgi:hypothetical protein